MQREDYLERMIRQMGEAIAHLLGVAKAGQAAQAQQAIDRLWDSVGLQRAFVTQLDPGSARMLLGAKVPLALQLLEAEVALAEQSNDAASATSLRALIRSLRG